MRFRLLTRAAVLACVASLTSANINGVVSIV